MVDIQFRAVIEVLGKPKEHVEKSMKIHIEQLKKDSNYQVLSVEFADLKVHEEQSAWSTFAEIEAKTDKPEWLTAFCFHYMPSIIEIIEPASVTLKDVQFTQFLNDLQARLHQVDAIAKQVKLENDFMKINMRALMKNYISVLLARKPLTSEQLSGLTGVEKDKLEDYLDVLIDEGKVDLKGDEYFLIENGKQ